VIWKIGFENDTALVISARRPVKVLLLRKTSRSTSFDMLSPFPGLGNPSASLLSWKELMRSAARDVKALDGRNAQEEDLEGSDMPSIAGCEDGAGRTGKERLDGCKKHFGRQKGEAVRF